MQLTRKKVVKIYYYNNGFTHIVINMCKLSKSSFE